MSAVKFVNIPKIIIEELKLSGRYHDIEDTIINSARYIEYAKNSEYKQVYDSYSVPERACFTRFVNDLKRSGRWF